MPIQLYVRLLMRIFAAFALMIVLVGCQSRVRTRSVRTGDMGWYMMNLPSYNLSFDNVPASNVSKIDSWMENVKTGDSTIELSRLIGFRLDADCLIMDKNTERDRYRCILIENSKVSQCWVGEFVNR